MGTVCSTTTKKTYEDSYKTNSPPQTQRHNHATTQDQLPSLTHFSQHLEEISACLRHKEFKIPVLKQDIRAIYKFEKTIGEFFFFYYFFFQKYNYKFFL